jgi:hypothetical protein
MNLKKLTLITITILLITSNVLFAEPCVASEAKPTTPTFTIVEISEPYDIPPSSTTIVDPYTGEKTTSTYPGTHVENTTTYIRPPRYL